jgi:hypothetical protein
MGASQLGFSLRRQRSPGENETQVACPVGRRRDDLADLRRDDDPGDSGNRLRGGQAFDALVDAALRNREHHDPCTDPPRRRDGRGQGAGGLEVGKGA